MFVRLDPAAALAVLSVFCVSTLAQSQTPISGALYDGAGGPLLAGVVYHASGSISVPAGKTLSIQPGAAIKFWSGGLSVDGTLVANGTAGSKIVFTSLQDDSVGGDTNANGPSAGAPDQWSGLSFGPTSDASSLDHVVIAYSGVGFAPALRVDAADITLRHSTLRNGQHGLLNLANGSKPTVEFCDFQHSGTQPSVFGATFDAVPGFQSNTASGSGVGNYIRIDSPSPAANVSIVADDCLNGWLVLSGGMNLPAGRTLTLGPGIVVKPSGASAIHVEGSLVTHGTQEAPVIFTSYTDDGYGGDTNNDGPSAGFPDQWYGLRFTATAGASALENTIVRYTGVGFSAALEISDSSPSFTDCLFREGKWSAIHLNGVAATPHFTRCAFQDNQNYAAQIPIGAVPGFVDCVALGSTYGQFLRVTNAAVPSSLVIGPENMVGGALVLASQLVVPPGVTLTVRRGTIFKTESGSGATIQGAMNVTADGASPVVFTTIADDLFGGDTNSNGPSSGATDTWTGVTFTAGSTGSVTGLRVRYAGLGFGAGIDVQSAGVTLRAARADECAHDGMRIAAHGGDARDWVAFNCRDRGIALGSGSFAVRNATVVGTLGTGIVNFGSFTGVVRDSITHGNSVGDIAGIPAGNVSWSLVAALAGQNDNFAVAPQFVNQGTGDLRLAFGSPCIDAGDPVNGPTGSSGADAGGAPRFTDGNLDGTRRLDVGAHEFTNVNLAITGNAIPGQSLTLATSGTAGLPVLLAIGFDGQVEAPPFGTLFINVAFPWLLLPFGSVPLSAPLPIPADLQTPLEVAFQAIAVVGPKANFSNVVHVRFTH